MNALYYLLYIAKKLLLDTKLFLNNKLVKSVTQVTPENLFSTQLKIKL